MIFIKNSKNLRMCVEKHVFINSILILEGHKYNLAIKYYIEILKTQKR